MHIATHAFLEIEFFGLIFFSIVLPVGIYGFLYRKASISRLSVVALAVVLILISGVDVFLLQALADIAKTTTSNFDDKIFSSGLSIALYTLPVAYVGIGVNLLSHILIDHLHRAESRHDRGEGKKFS